FSFYGGGAFDKQFGDEPARRTGLLRHQHLAEHGFGFFIGVFSALANFDSSLKAALESSLASSASMDLRFNNDAFVAGSEQRLRGSFRFLWSGTDLACGHSDSVLRQQLFGLIFVYVHLSEAGPKSKTQGPKSTGQRCLIGITFNPTGPTYSLCGRIKRLSASCSSTWAVQPAVRAMANKGVKRSVGIPSE